MYKLKIVSNLLKSLNVFEQAVYRFLNSEYDKKDTISYTLEDIIENSKKPNSKIKSVTIGSKTYKNLEEPYKKFLEALEFYE